MALISSIYRRGDESAAHYKRQKGTRSRNWAFVPKNVVKVKTRNVNIAQHAYECKHGYAPLVTRLEDFV